MDQFDVDYAVDLETSMTGVHDQHQPLWNYGAQPPLETHAKNPKHKREVCRYWLQRRCQKGSSCEFLHVLDESKMPTCPYGLSCDRLSGMLEPCPFQHPVKETRCANYDAGFCSFGHRCAHEHVPAEGPPPEFAQYFFVEPKRKVSKFARTAPCSYFASHGWCPYFEMCNFLHVRK